MTIDWNAPLEAYHPEKDTVPVELEPKQVEVGLYEIVQELGEDRACLFEVDGRHHFGSEWRIRNRTEKPAPQYPVELVEVKNLLREVVEKTNFVKGWGLGDPTVAKVLAFLEPVDPDLELAREIVEAGSFRQSTEEMVFAAIKHVRAETQDASNVKGS